MKTYDPTMASRFRKALLARASQLGDSLEADVHSAAFGARQDIADFKDVAEHEAQELRADVQAMRSSASLDEICAALTRIRNGSYGRCADCGGAIDLQRLVAMPEASRCALCQDAHEKARRAYR